MDFSQIIDNMWDAYDLTGTGYIDKNDAMDLTEGVCKHVQQLNQNYNEKENSLRAQHGLPPLANGQNTTKHFNQNLFDQLFQRYNTGNDKITKANL